MRKDTERDYFMTSEEAREYGIIDKVITSRETPNQLAEKRKA